MNVYNIAFSRAFFQLLSSVPPFAFFFIGNYVIFGEDFGIWVVKPSNFQQTTPQYPYTQHKIQLQILCNEKKVYDDVRRESIKLCVNVKLR